MSEDSHGVHRPRPLLPPARQIRHIPPLDNHRQVYIICSLHIHHQGYPQPPHCKYCGQAGRKGSGHHLDNAGLMRERHNTILQRLVKAANKEDKDLFVEQSFSPDALHPDIVLHDRLTKNAVVVDVTLSYESGPDAFCKARSEKEQKYNGLKAWMEVQDNYNLVEVHAFIVAPLEPGTATTVLLSGPWTSATTILNFSPNCAPQLPSMDRWPSGDHQGGDVGKEDTL